jgi:hypothetical protein
MRTVTGAQAKALRDEFGSGVVEFIEITAFGDPEQMFIVGTPDCEYCGSLQPHAKCIRCGAPAKGVQHPVWR